MAGYTQEPDPERTSKAIGLELPISPKKSVEICRELRGMNVEDAKRYLEEVIEMKRPVPYKRHVKGTAHKRGKKMAAGGYPQKAAQAILNVIESAQHNAEYKGMNFEDMKIETIAAHRGRVYWKFKPRAHGRATPHNQETTNVEVILRVLEE